MVLAAGTGGAWAVDQINGSRLKAHSVAGKKLKDNTVKGKQVKESKLGKVPKAALADTATLAANAGKLGGVGSAGFVKGPGRLLTGRTSEPAGQSPNVVKTFATPVGEFRLSCNNSSADARYHNTTAGDADVFRAFVGSSATGTDYDLVAENATEGYSVNFGNGPEFMDMRVGKGTAVAILRVGERRTSGGDCIFDWELVTPA